MQLSHQNIGTFKISVPTHGLVSKGSVAPVNAGSRLCGVTMCARVVNVRLILRHFQLFPTFVSCKHSLAKSVGVIGVYDVNGCHSS